MKPTQIDIIQTAIQEAMEQFGVKMEHLSITQIGVKEALPEITISPSKEMRDFLEKITKPGTGSGTE